MAKRMTREQKDYFFEQVKRKGKAMELRDNNPKKFEKWEVEYQKIVQYLRKNVKWFLLSEIVRNDRYMDWNLLKEILEEEKDDMLTIFSVELNNGHVPELNLILFMIHAKYMARWKGKNDKL